MNWIKPVVIVTLSTVALAAFDYVIFRAPSGGAGASEAAGGPPATAEGEVTEKREESERDAS